MEPRTPQSSSKLQSCLTRFWDSGPAAATPGSAQRLAAPAAPRAGAEPRPCAFLVKRSTGERTALSVGTHIIGRSAGSRQEPKGKLALGIPTSESAISRHQCTVTVSRSAGGAVRAILTMHPGAKTPLRIRWPDPARPGKRLSCLLDSTSGPYNLTGNASVLVLDPYRKSPLFVYKLSCPAAVPLAAAPSPDLPEAEAEKENSADLAAKAPGPSDRAPAPKASAPPAPRTPDPAPPTPEPKPPTPEPPLRPPSSASPPLAAPDAAPAEGQKATEATEATEAAEAAEATEAAEAAGGGGKRASPGAPAAAADAPRPGMAEGGGRMRGGSGGA